MPSCDIYSEPHVDYKHIHVLATVAYPLSAVYIRYMSAQYYCTTPGPLAPVCTTLYMIAVDILECLLYTMYEHSVQNEVSVLPS